MTISQRNRKPVVLLTGFLGSGKTTFLNALLKKPEYANSLVIINEFGKVPVDHLLVEQSAETLFELSNGCLCCSVRGELVETLTGLDLDRFDRIFIETTGIADPLPVFQVLTAHPELSKQLMPAAILCVFDLERGITLLETHAEAKNQLALADTVLLTKQDRAGEKRDESLKAIRSLNPHAQVINASDLPTSDRLLATVDDKPFLKVAHGHSGSYKSVGLETEKLLSPQDLYGALAMIASHYGDKLLRIKGHALLSGFSAPVVIQVSGTIIHEPEPTERQIDQTRLVAIFKDTDPAYASELFNAIVGNVMPDQADRDALLENPLAIPGT